jgi:hypothetical protein
VAFSPDPTHLLPTGRPTPEPAANGAAPPTHPDRPRVFWKVTALTSPITPTRPSDPAEPPTGDACLSVPLIPRPVLFGNPQQVDPAVSPEGRQLIAALQANNVAYEYLLFADESHGLVKPEGRLRLYAAAERFLAEHLGGRAEPGPTGVDYAYYA